MVLRCSITCAIAGRIRERRISRPCGACLPGWRAIVSGGCLRLERYWDPVPQDPTGRMVDGCRRRRASSMRSSIGRSIAASCNGRTGIFLSGGLDSISVAAVAQGSRAATGSEPAVGLVARISGPRVRRARLLQAAVARDLGLPQHLVDFHEAVGTRPRCSSSRSDWLGKLAAPILNPWFPAYLGLARCAQSLDGVRTILTGNGGDEWLTVTPFLSSRFDSPRCARRAGSVLRYVAPIVSSQSVRTCSQRCVAMRTAATWRHGASPAISGRSCCRTCEAVFGRRSGVARPRS